MVKIVTLLNTYSHFNTFKMVNSATVNCHSATVNCHFKYFLSHKYYFNFKFNYFKCLNPNTRSHSNTFKIINLFYLFQIRIDKITRMIVNTQARICEPNRRERDFLFIFSSLRRTLSYFKGSGDYYYYYYYFIFILVFSNHLPGSFSSVFFW